MSEETGMAVGVEQESNLEAMVNRVQSLHHRISRTQENLEVINDGLFGIVPSAQEPEHKGAAGDGVFYRMDQSLLTAESNFELLEKQIRRLKDGL